MINESKRIRLGICQWSLPVEGPYACKAAADLGLEGIELNFDHDIGDEPLSRQYVRQAYLEEGREWRVTYPTLGLNILCTYGMSKPEYADRAKAVFIEAIKIASAMEIPLLQVPSFVNGEINSEAELLQTAEILKYACKNAQADGIVIGTENTLSTQDHLKLLEAAGCDNLKVYFDTQNPYVFKGYDAAAMAEALGDQIIEVHAKDGANGKVGSAYLGEGDSGFAKTVESLNKAGYSGWVITENDYSHPPIGTEGENHLMLIKKDIETIKRYFIA